MTRPISPTALRALAALAADPLARVHPATRAEIQARRDLLREGLITRTFVEYKPGHWRGTWRVTPSGRALLEGQER